MLFTNFSDWLAFQRNEPKGWERRLDWKRVDTSILIGYWFPRMEVLSPRDFAYFKH